MTDQELERRLERALSHSAPDDLEGVLSRCETRKGNVIPMKKNKTPAVRWLAACLALLLVGGGSGVIYQQAYAVASVVSLDVNPSIELKVNKNEKVLSCTPLNEDAAEILADMGGGADLKGTKLDVAVNAIVGSLVRYGYLDDISSAILISVEDKDQDRAARLQEELTAAVDAVLQDQSANAAVLSQTLTQDAALEEQAKENNISTGKAALVNQVLAINSGLKFDQLATLSVEELKDLIETGVPGMPIGKSAALEAAEKYAGIQSADSVTGEVDPELDETPAHYEVELHHPTLGKFEYEVDAYTGAVLSGQPDILKASGGTTSGTTSGTTGGTTAASGNTAYIGETAAKTAALTHAGVQASAVKYCNAWLEYENGRPECYKVEFEVNGAEYEYEIDLYSGGVLSYESEAHSSSGSAASSSTAVKTETSSSTGTYIGESKAKAAALANAGVQESAVKYCNVWLEYENGRPECYKVEFEVNGTQYEYEIDLYSGAVLSHESETHGSFSGTSDASKEEKTSAANIGEDAAKAAALKHAGVQESQITKLKVEREDEDGRLVYEVEFKAGKAEYQYKIDGSTGAVLKYEADEED